MASNTDSRDQAVICSICLEEYEVPKLLTCFHSFCKRCLEQHAGRTTVSGHFPCPQCRESVKLPPKGVQGFQTNFYITNIRENSKESNEKQPENNKTFKVCGFCRNQESRFECRTCRKLLCNGCKKTHKKPKSNRNHHIVLIREEPVVESNDNILCPKHKARGEILAYYCVRCDVPICMSCKLTAHEGHKSEDMDDRIVRVKTSLRESSFETQRLVHSLEDMKANGMKTEARCHSFMDEVLEDIARDREDVLKMVNARSKCLEGQLKRKAQTTLDTISGHLENIDEQMKKLDDVKSKIDNCLEKGSYQEMCQTSKGLKEKLETMKTQMPQKIDCNPNFTYDHFGCDRSRKKLVENIFGKISTDQTVHDKKLMPRGTSILATFTIPKNVCKTRAMATSEDGIMICYDPSNTSIDTVTEAGSIKSGTNFAFEVTSIANNDHGFIFVASAKKKAVYSFLLETVIPVAEDLPLPPLAITKADESIIYVGSMKSVKGGIVRVSITGAFTTWIFKDEEGIIFKKPADVAYWSKGKHTMIIVTDPKAHRVVFFSKLGFSYHVTKIYSGEGLHKDEEQFCPHGVCVDKLGNIFVADPSSQSVIQLSRKGKLMEDQTMMFEEDFVPKTLTVTSKCHLVVGSTENKVKVVKRANP